MKKRSTRHPRTYESRLRPAIITVLDRPAVISEIIGNITKTLNLDKPPKITSHIHELEKTGILKILTPKLKKTQPGKVYGLTTKGVRYKKQISKKNGGKFMYKEVPGVNWYDYGWCAIGRQKKAVMLALDAIPLRQVELFKIIKEKYTNRNKTAGITRQNLNDLLKLMLERGIAVSVEDFKKGKIKRNKKPVIKYRLSGKGLKIKEQLLA
jgi:DNA-binding PadR family transcriptional regulator